MVIEVNDIFLDIFYEDDVLLIINKLVGLVVYFVFGYLEGILVNVFLVYCDFLVGIGGV